MNTIRIIRAPDVERLRTAFFSEDDVGALIRCHYEVEKSMDYVLETLTSGRSSELVGLNYYAQKVEALYMLGVSESYLSPLKVINKVRNSFSHKGIDVITDNNVRGICAAIQPILPSPIDDFEVRFHGRTEFSGKFKDLPARQKFVIGAAMALSLLSAYPERLREATAAANTTGPLPSK